MTIQNRFKIKKGKFGCYFYDSITMIDMSLEMVLTKLNNKLNERKQLRSISYLLKDVVNLKNELRELKIKLEVYKKASDKL